jgi:hypothetical protein
VIYSLTAGDVIPVCPEGFYGNEIIRSYRKIPFRLREVPTEKKMNSGTNE